MPSSTRALLFVALLCVGSAAAATTDSVNFIVGTQAIYGPSWRRYNFTNMGALRESADAVVHRLGGTQLKVSLSKNSCKGYALDCSAVASLRDLVQLPDYRAVFSDPGIRYYQMWVSAWATGDDFLKKDWTPAALDAEYEEVKAWAVHMLNEYRGTGKVFFAGNWEGDWKLDGASGCTLPNGKHNLSCDPTPDVLARYRQWARVRQQAVDDARAEVAAATSDAAAAPPQLFYYIEFNLGPAALNGRPGIINSVLQDVNPDLASYSSYSTSNDYQRVDTPADVAAVDTRFVGVLKRAAGHLQDKPGLTTALRRAGVEQRVMIGEYGMHAAAVGTAWPRQRRYMACLNRAAVAFGAPFVLYWELYDNDSTIPIVPRSGEDTPLLQYLRGYYADARAWVAARTEAHAGAAPMQAAFRAWAAARFERECAADV